MDKFITMIALIELMKAIKLEMSANTFQTFEIWQD
jgi:hypothetical protein